MEIEVVVEVPRGSGNKYEADHRTGAITLDRPLSPALRYPTDYGYVPGTLGEDGDPLDALLLLEEPAFPGCHVRCRPVGLFRMRDEAGPDCKLVAVPHWDARAELGDLSDSLLAVIRHFFEVYKDLDPDRHSEVLGWAERPAAEAELLAARKRFVERA
ncbi:MAG: inorganic diphosphatase [Chloroflexi bacterium]|nr:MAG: inorganic diphosphatase [Chloroflexota bacterium]